MDEIALSNRQIPTDLTKLKPDQRRGPRANIRMALGGCIMSARYMSGDKVTATLKVAVYNLRVVIICDLERSGTLRGKMYDHDDRSWHTLSVFCSAAPKSISDYL